MISDSFLATQRATPRRMMNTKKEDLDEKEEASSWDLVDAFYEYLMKKEYPKDCMATKKRQIRKKAEKFRIEGGELICISNGKCQKV